MNTAQEGQDLAGSDLLLDAIAQLIREFGMSGATHVLSHVVEGLKEFGSASMP